MHILNLTKLEKDRKILKLINLSAATKKLKNLLIGIQVHR